jgi:hypothetical protein
LGFHLSTKTSNKLKAFLNRYLRNDLDKTLEAINNSDRKEQLLKYPFRLIRVESPQVDSNFVLVHKEYSRPYCLIIGKAGGPGSSSNLGINTQYLIVNNYLINRHIS